MRYKTGHRDEARARILLAVGRGFRKHGFGGIGVDGLAKEAEVTSGAFYGHFSSKADAFNEAAIVGIADLRAGVLQFQADWGSAWVEHFIDFYLTTRRTCDLAEGCALQTLTPEVARASTEVRANFEAELLKVVEAVAQGLTELKDKDRMGAAWALLSLLSGAVTAARSVNSSALSLNIAEGARAAALLLVNAKGG